MLIFVGLCAAVALGLIGGVALQFAYESIEFERRMGESVQPNRLPAFVCWALSAASALYAFVLLARPNESEESKD